MVAKDRSSDFDICIFAGSLDLAVLYSGLPIYSETRDLCDMASCPIKKGDLEIAYDQYLPPIVPPVRSASIDACQPAGMKYTLANNVCLFVASNFAQFTAHLCV